MAYQGWPPFPFLRLPCCVLPETIPPFLGLLSSSTSSAGIGLARQGHPQRPIAVPSAQPCSCESPPRKPANTSHKVSKRVHSVAPARQPATMPQTIMLAVHCKKSEPVELKGPIVQYVKRSYGDQARHTAPSQAFTRPLLRCRDAAACPRRHFGSFSFVHL